MFVPGWIMWCVLLTPQMSARGLEISGYDSHEVICSQGLSDCTMKDELPLIVTESNAVDVRNLTPSFKLCCKDTAPCTLCLVIDAEITINPDKDMEEEGHSGHDEEDYSEEMERNPKASVTVCYSAVSSMPMCKKVEFTVNHTALAQPNQAKFSMVITEPPGVSYSSHVMVYSSKPSHLSREVVVPSLDEVCSLELKERLEECRVPRLSSVINTEMNWVELQFGRNESLPSVCIQYEQNGRCQKWSRTTIPLDSVTPCMCLKVWDEDDQRSRRSLSCPFTNTDFLQRNVWQNVSVSVSQGQMINHHTMLLWNLSAPCRLEGEVWPCFKESSCREMKGFRQQLANGTWRQNSKGLWEKMGVFEDINLQLSPCVMVKVKGMGHELGPFCFKNTDRHRWSLLVVGVMLLVCLTVLVVYLLHDFVKKCVGRCRYVGREGHVVLLSPPDMDDGVSESVCRLGSQLRTQGFSVSVDQWSRKELCNLGPLPWLHSQLLELNSQGGRVVLALTPKALKKVEEWTRLSKDVIKTKGEDKGLPQICSPYSDVFTASLCLIEANKRLGRANERFLLVKFDSHHISDESLPELFQGLPLFKFPSKTQALLSALTVGGTERASGKRTWTGWKWSGSDGWRARTKEEQSQQKDSCGKYVGDEKNLETKPLKCP
uniref:interleukin-17 receptor C isoform X1 n=1 Tax=Epinephelus lanceolatus TaxID=310571 RepID=UPI0014483F19|nr:interleukin-17 receptor C isoform X1 [Epinephelus lanceolatus]XP_033483131.1 interleukin-17 receptor C isoform X1 [Epinephelus lanceolatus]